MALSSRNSRNLESWAFVCDVGNPLRSTSVFDWEGRAQANHTCFMLQAAALAVSQRKHGLRRSVLALFSRYEGNFMGFPFTIL
jgi:hypothetical protein